MDTNVFEKMRFSWKPILSTGSLDFNIVGVFIHGKQYFQEIEAFIETNVFKQYRNMIESRNVVLRNQETQGLRFSS